MSEAAGLVNVYLCERCGGKTVTKNRDEGTTPFMLVCRVTPKCLGTATSSFYRVSQELTPRILFIRPTEDELLAFLAEHPGYEHDIREHVRMGGLLDIDAPAPVLVH